jgi:hypothetical protein
MHQQLWGYKVEEKLYLGVREQKRLNTTGLDDWRVIQLSILEGDTWRGLSHWTPFRGFVIVFMTQQK